MLRNTLEKYGSVAKFFHWLMALLIVMLLIVGFTMINLPKDPDTFKLYGLHKSIGACVLILALFRLLWRENNIIPKLPDWMKSYERFAAHTSHAALYGLMFAMPFSGWAMSSAAGFQVSVFGLVTLPNIVAPDKASVEFFRDVHWYLAWMLVAMICAHVGAALLHHFYYKDNVLRGMLPFQKDEPNV